MLGIDRTNTASGSAIHRSFLLLLLVCVCVCDERCSGKNSGEIKLSPANRMRLRRRKQPMPPPHRSQICGTTRAEPQRKVPARVDSLSTKNDSKANNLDVFVKDAHDGTPLQSAEKEKKSSSFHFAFVVFQRKH